MAAWISRSAEPWQQALFGSTTCCYISTDVHQSCEPPAPLCCWPPWSVSHCGISVTVSGCADVDPSLLEDRREAIICVCLPAPTPRHMTFCGRLMPSFQATGDLWPLSPSSTRDPHTWLNPPAVTLSDKDTCALTLIQPYPSPLLAALCGRWSLLQVITVQCAEIKRASYLN